MVDTALKTASAGYLTRRLVDVAQDVVVKEEDCKDKNGYTLYASDGKVTGESIGKRLRGRVLLEEIKDKDGNIIAKKNQLVDRETSIKIEQAGPETVKIRSLIPVKHKDGVCRMCYGHDLSKNKLIEIGRGRRHCNGPSYRRTRDPADYENFPHRRRCQLSVTSPWVCRAFRKYLKPDRRQSKHNFRG